MQRPHVTAVGIAGQYFAYFATIGVTQPFMSAYLGHVGLTGAQVGTLLALTPLMTLFAPGFWGQLADRTGRPDRLLTVLLAGSLACLVPLVWVRDFRGLALSLGGYSLFISSATLLMDSLALQRVAAVGGHYARLRLFGSLGFIMSTTALGLAVDRIDERIVWTLLALMAAALLWSLTLRVDTPPARKTAPGDGRVWSAALGWLLVASSLHWVACAPFHGTFGLHVTSLGLPPSVVGLAAGLGVVAEVGVMFLRPRLALRISDRTLLGIALAGGVVRWAVMASTSNPVVIVAISLLHGLTFGAFYVAMVSLVAGLVPSEARARGQALFVTATMGLGGLVGFLAAGAGWDQLGGHRLFAVAAVVDLVALLLVLASRPRAR